MKSLFKKHIIINTVIITTVILFSAYFMFSQESSFSTLRQNYEYISSTLQQGFSYALPALFVIIIVLVVTKLIITLLRMVLKKYFDFTDQTKEFYRLFLFVKYAIWSLVIVLLVFMFFGNITAVIASLGLIGFGITFALQKPILNFVGWLTIIFNKTFYVGDRIQIGEVRGDVLSIDVMYTQLDGMLSNSDELSGKVVTVPNEMVLTGSITNFTKNGEFVWDEVGVTITYESDWKEGEKLLERAALDTVEKYVVAHHKKTEERHESIIRIFDALNHEHRNESNMKKKRELRKDLKRVREEKENIQVEKERMEKALADKVMVRVGLKESAIELNVRYLANYRFLRTMKSEIYSEFLALAAKHDDVEIAYPHMQLVFDRNNILKSMGPEEFSQKE